MINLSALLGERALRQPEACACVLGDTRLSYAQLDAAASQVAGGLRELGLRPGDTVALTCPNIPFFPIAYHGILKAGCVVVPLNVLLKRREVAYHLRDSGARAFVCFEGNPAVPMGEEGHAAFSETDTCEHFLVATADPAAANPFPAGRTLGQLMHGQAPGFEPVPRRPDDTAVILYTSGTTGQPKGAELTQFNMFFNAVDTARMLRYSPDDRGLVTLPLFHSFGQTVMMNALLHAGGTMVMLPRFDPSAAAGLMVSEGVTVFCGVPTMYWALLQRAKDKEIPLRVCVSGGAALPLAVLREFEDTFGAPILEGYGLSETSPVACFNQLEFERRPGSIGKPVWGVTMRVVDEQDQDLPPGEVGEIVIRGYNVMKGYLGRPEATAEAMRGDWFHTGDLGRRDEDGYFHIVDRTKDMIIRGGFNVYPREVEEMLLDHPAISMAAVIGVPHPSHGEEIKAFVVLDEGAEAAEADLVAWARDTMAAYKYPRQFEIRETLPMNATGKILKRDLREAGGQ